MLTVKIEENYKDALDEMGMEYRDRIFVMSMRDSGKLMGIGIMKLVGNFVALDGIHMKDEFKSFDLEYGLGKSMLNFVDLRGIKNVISNIDDSRLMTALRFKPSDECDNCGEIPQGWTYCLNLEGYFASNC